jgi:ketosteroid isomerase-like protein
LWLTELNRGYVRSVQESDVGWFAEHLADDFLATISDGSLLDRAAFLEHTAHPVTIRDLEPHDVAIRLLGDIAIIHARTTFAGADGRPGASRYTDVWARRDGRWLAIAAQVTRY